MRLHRVRQAVDRWLDGQMEDDKLDEGETSKKFKKRLETHPNLTKQLDFSSDLGGGQPTSAAQARSARLEDPSERFVLSFCSDGTLAA